MHAPRAFAKRFFQVVIKDTQLMRAALATAFGVLLIAPAAHAEYDPVAWIGGGYGLSIPNENNSTTRPAFAFDVGAKIGTEWGVSAYYNQSHKDESANGITTPFNYDMYGVMGAYYFEGEARGVYLGAMLGMSKVGTSAQGATYSTSPMHWGLVAGYDYFLGDHFSLGGRAEYFSVAASNTSVSTSAGANFTGYTDSFSILDVMLTARVWF